MFRKQIIYFIFLFFLSSRLYSTPFDYNFDDDINPDVMLAFKDGEGYIFEAARQEYVTFGFDRIYEKQNGYSYINLFNKECAIVLGDLTGFIVSDIGSYPAVLTNLEPIMKSAHSSSFLTEKIKGGEVAYKASNLVETVIDAGNRGMLWNLNYITSNSNKWKNSTPWVEGVSDSGIGEWLDITFKRKVDTISILNGYVDFQKPYLYKANNRLKKISISSESIDDSFEFDYFFNDKVQLHTISLPHSTDEVSIEILDVYTGDKYDDTVISGIFSEKSVEYRIRNYNRAFDEPSFEVYLKHYKKFSE